MSEPVFDRCDVCGGRTITFPSGHVEVTHARLCPRRDEQLEHDGPVRRGRCPVCDGLIDWTTRSEVEALAEHADREHPEQVPTVLRPAAETAAAEQAADDDQHDPEDELTLQELDDAHDHQDDRENPEN